MIYTVSDLHGCLEDWQTLLDTIHFSDQDTMFVQIGRASCRERV